MKGHIPRGIDIVIKTDRALVSRNRCTQGIGRRDDWRDRDETVDEDLGERRALVTRLLG